MKAAVRAAVVYVANRLIEGTKTSCVFDHVAGVHHSLGGTVNDLCVNVFDRKENCHLTGHFSVGQYLLHHEKAGVYVSLRVDGNVFGGFDYIIGRPYKGMIKGCAVTVFDDAEGKKFVYTV